MLFTAHVNIPASVEYKKRKGCKQNKTDNNFPHIKFLSTKRPQSCDGGLRRFNELCCQAPASGGARSTDQYSANIA